MSYGADVWCADKPILGRKARGTTAVVLALYRRLKVPRGTLLAGSDIADDEGTYGFDIAEFVGAVGYDTAIGAIPAMVRAELMKDDRVSDVHVTISREDLSDGTIFLTLDIDAVLSDTGEDFTFTVGVTNVTASLLGVG